MHHRNAIRPPPPAHDTLRDPITLDDGEPAESGRFVIDPSKAATMRAEWAASAGDTLPCAESVLDAETSPALWGAYPGSLS